MEVRNIDRFLPEFDEAAVRAADGTFYHTSAWVESLSRSFPALSFRSMVAEDAGEIVGYLPYFVVARGPLRALWSMPFGTYGGPIVSGDESARRLLLDAYVRLLRGRNVYLVGLVDFHNRTESAGIEEATHVLDLSPGFDAVWSNGFEKSKRRQTRKAEREGLRVVEARSQEDVRRYYRIYREKAEQWGERFIYPEVLFLELFERRQAGVKLFLVRRDDTLLGGHLNFYFNRDVIAWNGVTSDDSRAHQAATLLYSTCIRDACDNGYARYNLGGSLGKRSLIDYKEALGATSYRYRTVCYRSLLGRAIAAVRRWKRPRR